MGRGGGRSGGGGLSSGGSRGLSSHRPSSPSRSSSPSFRSSTSGIKGSSSVNHSVHRGGGNPGSMSTPKPFHSSPPKPTQPPKPIQPQKPVQPSRHMYTPPRTVIINNSPPAPSGSCSNPSYTPKTHQTTCEPTLGNTNITKKERFIPGWYKWICILMTIIAVILLVFAGFARGQAKNNIPRERLPASACISTNKWIDDQVAWLSDTATVKDSMEYFYKMTGVQPYLLICRSLGSKGWEITDEEAKGALMELYDSLYDDEGHMIFAFMEYADSEYITWIYTGRSADAVIDEEAREIFLNNADRYYTDSSLSDDQYFAKISKKSADEIMADYSGSAATANAYTFLSILILIIMAVGLMLFKLREQKIKEREQLKEYISMPISKSPELQDLEDKYGNNQT